MPPPSSFLLIVEVLVEVYKSLYLMSIDSPGGVTFGLGRLNKEAGAFAPGTC